MSKGPGKVMSAILARIERDRERSGVACLSAERLAYECYGIEFGNIHWAKRDREPTRSEMASVLRAMHSICRKSNQYALSGGKGRKPLYIYDASDALSSTYAAMCVQSRGHVGINAAKKALAASDPEYAKQYKQELHDEMRAKLAGAGYDTAAFDALLASRQTA